MKKKFLFAFILIISVIIPLQISAQSADVFRQEGIASWYGREFEGRPTASGEIFNASLFTAAHPSLPFGTVVIVTNQHNNKSVIVRINDRGPFVSARIIDVSRAAAEQLDMVVTGTAPVTVMSIDRIAVSNPSASAERSEALAIGTQVSPQANSAISEVSAAAQQMTAQSNAEALLTSQIVVQANTASAVNAAVNTAAASAAQFKLTPEINIDPVKNYRLQAGSYRNARNAIDAFTRLSNAGLNPSYERFINTSNEEYYRVVLSGVNGSNIQLTIEKMSLAGFAEALIRAEN